MEFLPKARQHEGLQVRSDSLSELRMATFLLLKVEGSLIYGPSDLSLSQLPLLAGTS